MTLDLEILPPAVLPDRGRNWLLWSPMCHIGHSASRSKWPPSWFIWSGGGIEAKSQEKEDLVNIRAGTVWQWSAGQSLCRINLSLVSRTQFWHPHPLIGTHQASMHNAYSETLPNVSVCFMLPGHSSLFDLILFGWARLRAVVLLEEGRGTPSSSTALLPITFPCPPQRKKKRSWMLGQRLLTLETE